MKSIVSDKSTVLVQMKQVRPLGRVTAGPESKILEGGSVLEERVAGDGEASRPYSAAGDGRDMPYE